MSRRWPPVSAGDQVARYYDDNLQRERARLSESFYNHLEKRLVLHLVDRYFAAGGRLLDVGGGPGSYSQDFLDRGFDITLVDISPRAVECAQEQYGGHPRFRALVLDATEVVSLGRESFDAVLSNGPFYHLIRRSDRDRAAQATWQVLKPGGRIIAAALTVYSFIRGLLTWEKHDRFLSDEVPCNPRVDGLWSDRCDEHDVISPYRTRPEPFRRFFERHGFRTMSMAACKGVLTGLKSLDEAPEAVQEKAAALMLATCEDPDTLGLSEHIFYVGEKATSA
ncbi:MAG: class I SAM-dependent methyltransferase [Anaerolineae bacterium]|nr:class I SAM-dependent methyltransferase [Anaerolineae bacterium]